MAGPLLECIQKRFRNVQEEYRHIQQLEVSLSQGKSLDEDQQRLLSSKNVILNVLDSLELLLKLSKQSSCRVEGKERRGNNGRYLCISNGFNIICLDLKDELKGHPFDLQPLPKIADMNFLDAKMVCGQQFPVIKKDPDLSGNEFSCFVYGGEYGDSVEDLACLKMYHLSMVDGTFSLSEQDTSTINPLHKPLYLPMLEGYGSNQIHVFETISPAWHTCSPIASPSNEIPNTCLPCGERFCCCSQYQIVIADQVYATDFYKKHFEVFNTATLKSYSRGYDCLYYVDSIRHVAELLTSGFGRCIGKFVHADSSNPLYVVIAIGNKRGGGRSAAAYLVTSTGQVLCYQWLPLFFGDFRKPFYGSQSRGTVISADEEGKTLCAIVPGTTRIEDEKFLFISIFTVEECVYGGSLVPGIWAQKHEEYENTRELPFAVEKSFLNVEVKEWNAYKLGKGDMKRFTSVSACFLSDFQAKL